MKDFMTMKEMALLVEVSVIVISGGLMMFYLLTQPGQV